jgi:hypothetical protein
MSDYVQKNLKGNLFKNSKKESESQPDYTGSAKVDEVEYAMSAWINEGKNGKYLSISFTSIAELQAKGIGQVKEVIEEKHTMPEDDIPF